MAQSSGLRSRITAPYLSRPCGFILPLSMIVGKYGVEPSFGSCTLKKLDSSAARARLAQQQDIM